MAADGPSGRDLDTALAWYLAELNERLVVHWTGGSWRVPLGLRHLPVKAADGRPLGRIVCAAPEDAVRAGAGLQPVPAPTVESLDRLLSPQAQLLARIRALEGFSGDTWNAASAARALAASPVPAAGPVALLTAADRPVSEVVGLLAAARGGVIWKPAPGAAASAHLVMRSLAPLIGPGLVLLQGDHETGTHLVDRFPPVWLRRAGA